MGTFAAGHFLDPRTGRPVAAQTVRVLEYPNDVPVTPVGGPLTTGALGGYERFTVPDVAAVTLVGPGNARVDLVSIERQLAAADVTLFKGTVATSTDLPAAGEDGDIYLAADTGHGWAWLDGAWVDTGPLRGPAGSDANVTDVNVAAAIGDNTTAALNPVIDARTGNGARPVGRGELAIDVRHYGAVGDNATDDTSAIIAAAAAAKALGPNTRLRFPAVPTGYRTTAPITVDGGVALDMDAPIIYAGTGGPALTVGDTSSVLNERIKHRGVRVRRATVAGDLSESVIGVRFINQYWSYIHLNEARNFTIGAEFLGTNNKGFAYNQITLGVLFDNQIHVQIMASAGGWANENTFYGGGFSNSSAFPAIDRIGVRITSTSNYYSNSNVFHRPSFEIDGRNKSFDGACVVAEYAGPGNKFLDVRYESPSTGVITRNSSRPVEFVTAYDEELPTISEEGVYAGTLLSATVFRSSDRAQRLVVRVPDLHRRACYADGATNVNVPGLNWLTSPTVVTETRHQPDVTITPRYLQWTSGRALGLYLSTVAIKRFALVTDAEPGSGGRMIVRCYDDAGNVLSAPGTIKGSRTTFTHTIYWGGGWTLPNDSNEPRFFAVSAETAYVWVGIVGGTNPIKVRSFAIYALDAHGDAATWLPWHDGDEYNRGTAPPTAGTWTAGRRIIRNPPVVGQPQGWVCTAAGTPGTWVALPNL